MGFGLPQESVLGLLLWILYTVDLICLVEDHGFIPQMYADDSRSMALVTLDLLGNYSMICLHVWMIVIVDVCQSASAEYVS